MEIHVGLPITRIDNKMLTSLTRIKQILSKINNINIFKKRKISKLLNSRNNKITPRNLVRFKPKHL